MAESRLRYYRRGIALIWVREGSIRSIEIYDMGSIGGLGGVLGFKSVSLVYCGLSVDQEL